MTSSQDFDINRMRSYSSVFSSTDFSKLLQDNDYNSLFRIEYLKLTGIDASDKHDRKLMISRLILPDKRNKTEHITCCNTFDQTKKH